MNPVRNALSILAQGAQDARAAQAQDNRNALRQFEMDQEPMRRRSMELDLQLREEQLAAVRAQSARAAKAVEDQAALEAELEAGQRILAQAKQGMHDPAVWGTATRFFGMDGLEPNEQSLRLMGATLDGMNEGFLEALVPKTKTVEPKLTEGADGYAYWVSPGQQPQRAIPGIEAAPSEPMVTVNTGDQTDKFRDELDKKDATFWSGVQDTGFAADRMLTRLSRLEDTLANAPTGVQGAITSFANSLGLDVPGGDEVSAAEAIINQLVPEQRQPGSGPMSDRDLEMFKRSLPSIINQPGGNAKIIQTMRAIAAYDREGAEISSRVFSGEISRQEGRRLLMGRADPLKDLRLGTTSDEEDTPPPPPPEEPAALIGTTVNEPAGARRRDRRQPSGSQFDIDGATYTVRPAQ